MKSMQEWFDEYGESHQNPTNKLIHWICVPSIFFSIVALLSEVPFTFAHAWFPVWFQPHVHLGLLIVLLGLLFYLRISARMFVGMLLVCVATLLAVEWIRDTIPLPVWQLAIGIFVAAWIGQFYGHKVEGKKPSFLKDLQFLMIGPAWLLGFIYKKLRLKY